MSTNDTSAWREFAEETRAVAAEAHRLAAEGGSPDEREAFAIRKAALLARMAEPGTVYRAERFGYVGPCPCECNSGGFCGGCGHAGCGSRYWEVVASVGLVHPEVMVKLTGEDGNAFAHDSALVTCVVLPSPVLTAPTGT